MRLVDNIVYNFPHLTPFDPYSLYPSGAPTASSPDLFAYLLAFVVRVLGPGSFSQQSIDTIAVYIPPVLGTLIIIPIYFIGREIFNRWVGLLAAAIFVVIPEEIGRSLLGDTGHQVAEVLFTTTFMMFFIMALKRGYEFDPRKPLNEQWRSARRSLIFSICAGICLGIYFLTWAGALFFTLLLFIYFLIQFIIDHLRGKPVDDLGLTGFVVGLVALLIIVVWRFEMHSVVPMLLFTLFTLFMSAFSRYLRSRRSNAWYFPLTIAVVGVLAAAIIFLVHPSFLRETLELAGLFFIPNLSITNMEMQPLLFTLGRFTWDAIFDSFTIIFYLSLAGIAVLIYHVVKTGKRDNVLLAVWCAVMLYATFAERRFGYYYGVTAALLTGYLCWLFLSLAGFGKTLATETAEAVRTVSKKARRKHALATQGKPSKRAMLLASQALSVIAVLFFVFYPNFGPLPDGARPINDRASHPSFAPSDAWCDALTWLRKNTPEPMGDASAYYKLWARPADGEQFNYPNTAYGVLAWWDTGYLITRIGRRIPLTNPAMGHLVQNKYAAFFMTEDVAQAGELLKSGGGRYIIIDFDTALPLKFYNIAASSGNNKEKYYDVYYQKQGNAMTPLILFYPEYYRTVMVRLYNFDGKAVTESNVTAISYQDAIDASGQSYKKITDYKTFKTFNEAQAYVAQQKTGNYKIGGVDPFVSPVTMDALADYKLEYGSVATKPTPIGGTVPEVKVFQYIKH
jgi:dolichyl-diphosphooligosaccharide--protein glycosyltransferase